MELALPACYYSNCGLLKWLNLWISLNNNMIQKPSETQATVDFDKSFTSYKPIPMWYHIYCRRPSPHLVQGLWVKRGLNLTPFLRAFRPSPLTQPGDSKTEQDVSVFIWIIKGTPMGKVFAKSCTWGLFLSKDEPHASPHANLC